MTNPYGLPRESHATNCSYRANFDELCNCSAPYEAEIASLKSEVHQLRNLLMQVTIPLETLHLQLTKGNKGVSWQLQMEIALALNSVHNLMNPNHLTKT